MSVVNDTPTRHQHLFIVRIWFEPAAQRRRHWRGSVEHIPANQIYYFTSLNGLNDFIALHLQDPIQTVEKGGDQRAVSDPCD